MLQTNDNPVAEVKNPRSRPGLFSPTRLIMALFAVYYSIFILQTSFVGEDGQRYFCLFDDGMISMRYAWNFSHGVGPVWNPGEHVEGYTNPLTTFSMTLVTAVFDKRLAVLVMQLLGVALLLGIGLVTLAIADELTLQEAPDRRRQVRILALVGALAYYPLVYWTLMGMETGLLTLLVLSAILMVLRYRRQPSRFHLLTTAALLGLAFLTRPDSLVLAAVVGGFWLLEVFLNRQFTLSKKLGLIAQFGGVYLLFVVGQEAFRWIFYGAGELVPNTYVLKMVGMTVDQRLKNGLGFVTPFLLEIGLALVIAGSGTFVGFSRPKGLLLAVLAVLVVYQVYTGGDAWNYWRIMSPAMPLVGLLVADSLVRFFSLLSVRFDKVRLPVGLASWLAMLAVLVVINWRFGGEATLSQPAYQVKLNERDVRQALIIAEVTQPSARVGLFAAGAIPYYSDRPGIDFLGKSDKYIANLPPDMSGAVSWSGMTSAPGHNKYDLDYSLKKLQPEYIEDYKWGRQNLLEWAKQNYVKIKYHNLNFIFKRNSALIDWQKLSDGVEIPLNAEDYS